MLEDVLVFIAICAAAGCLLKLIFWALESDFRE
jgi:hypothetical protein